MTVCVLCYHFFLLVKCTWYVDVGVAIANTEIVCVQIDCCHNFVRAWYNATTLLNKLFDSSISFQKNCDYLLLSCICLFLCLTRIYFSWNIDNLFCERKESGEEKGPRISKQFSSKRSFCLLDTNVFHMFTVSSVFLVSNVPTIYKSKASPGPGIFFCFSFLSIL